MKTIYRISADGIWLVHFAVVLIALFGWLFPSIWPLYVSVLIGTMVSTLSLGYCIVSKWEYDLRQKIHTDLSYDFTYASYYTYRLTHGRLSPSFLARTGVLFCGASLVNYFYFHFAF